MEASRSLLVGIDARRGVLHAATPTPGSGFDVTLAAGSAAHAPLRVDAIVLVADVAAAPYVGAALDWSRQQLNADGRLYAPLAPLRAAAVPECFPPQSAEVVLGASGFADTAATSVPPALAAFDTVHLRATLARVQSTDAQCAAAEWLQARPAAGISFVTPSIDSATLTANVLRSPAVQSPRNELIVECRGAAVQAALNAGIGRARHELIVVLHEDVYLPPLWEGMLRRGVRLVEAQDPNWGVVGCAGMRRRFGLLRTRRRGAGHSRDHSATWGQPFDAPVPVETLDEFLIAFRRDRGFRFDEQQPNYHFYAVDLCLQAAERSLRAYAIEAFCYHNSRPKQRRDEAAPADFVAGCDYLRRKWATRLPIVTTCTIIARRPADDHHARRARRLQRRATRAQWLRLSR